MIEALFDKTTSFLFPKLCSEIINSMDELHEKQDPPYSKGLLGIEIHHQFTRKKLSHYYLYWNISEPVLTNMARYDYFYVDPDFSRYARVRLEGYLTFSENMAKRYPGYLFDK